MDNKLPAQKLGGLYKNNCHKQGRFCRGLSVPFTVNRVLREGEGMFLFKPGHRQAENEEPQL